MSNNNDNQPDVVMSQGQGGGNNNKRTFNRQGRNNQVTKFEGRCDDLKGHVYDYGDSKNANQFIITTKEIKNYVGRNYKSSGDITLAINDFKIPTKKEPTEPSDPTDRIALKKWERQYDDHCKWKKTLDENVITLYNLVWGQCSESMQQKVESNTSFAQVEKESNGIKLLLLIKNTRYDYQSHIFEKIQKLKT